jgi:hypothetical protein
VLKKNSVRRGTGQVVKGATTTSISFDPSVHVRGGCFPGGACNCNYNSGRRRLRWLGLVEEGKRACVRAPAPAPPVNTVLLLARLSPSGPASGEEEGTGATAVRSRVKWPRFCDVRERASRRGGRGAGRGRNVARPRPRRGDEIRCTCTRSRALLAASVGPGGGERADPTGGRGRARAAVRNVPILFFFPTTSGRSVLTAAAAAAAVVAVVARACSHHHHHHHHLGRIHGLPRPHPKPPGRSFD